MVAKHNQDLTSHSWRALVPNLEVSQSTPPLSALILWCPYIHLLRQNFHTLRDIYTHSWTKPNQQYPQPTNQLTKTKSLRLMPPPHFFKNCIRKCIRCFEKCVGHFMRETNHWICTKCYFTADFHRSVANVKFNVSHLWYVSYPAPRGYPRGGIEAN